MSNKIYPIGIQNFESLRQDGYFYIDKKVRLLELEKADMSSLFVPKKGTTV